MNIDNLNPENNNQNNLNSGINPPEPNIAPVEPNFGTPPINPTPMQGPTDVPPVSPAPMQGPADVLPVNPVPMQGPADVPPVNPGPIPAPMEAPVNPEPMSSINLAPEGVASNTPVIDPPSPLMGATLTANTPLTNEQQMNNSSINNQGINPNNNMISENPTTFGGVPTPQNVPIMDNMLPSEPPKKKGGKKAVIIILIFVLILGIGAGVYYFLNVANGSSSKPSISIVPTVTEWELGKKLSKNASDYATINGVDASSCTVNTDAINVNTPNTYTGSITCPGSEAVSFDLKVRDTKGPEVVVKELTVKPNTEVDINDFITKCDDPSISNDCDIEINDDSIDLKELVTKAGTYTIPLIIKDDFDNATEVSVTLNVDENAPSQFLSCEIAEPFKTTTNATVTENYEYGLNDNNEIVNVVRKITYKFKKQEDYEKVKNDYNENSQIDELTGEASFDDDKNTIDFKIELEVSDIQKEFDYDKELKTYEDITLYHEDAGDFCSLP